MAVFRVDKSRDYTVLSNHIFKDRTLSAKAKGLLAEMLSLPESWDYTLKGLTYLFSDGLDSVRQGIKELEEHGYVVRERKRDEKGRLGDMEYVIYETPHKAASSENTENTPVCASPVLASPMLEESHQENPILDFPVQAEPVQENSTQLNNNILNNNLSITHESNPNPSFKEPTPIYTEPEPMPMDVMGYEEAQESRTVALTINTAKLTGRLFKTAICKYLEHRKNKQRDGPVIPHGKQSVKQLIGQNQGVSTIESNDPHIKDFEKIARKYGVDYAIKKVKTEDKPKYVIFFKARDADALTQAFTEYTRKSTEREKRPSVREKLRDLTEKVKNKVLERTKTKQRGQEL